MRGGLPVILPVGDRLIIEPAFSGNGLTMKTEFAEMVRTANAKAPPKPDGAIDGGRGRRWSWP